MQVPLQIRVFGNQIGKLGIIGHLNWLSREPSPVKSSYRHVGFGRFPVSGKTVSQDLAGTLHVECSELPLIAHLDDLL
jgi:hypothetical protein